MSQTPPQTQQSSASYISPEKLTLLFEVSNLINSTLDLKKLLKTILDAACDVLQAEAGSVMLIDHATNELIFEVAEGEKEDKLQQIRVPMGKGIAGWVAEHGEPLLVPDVDKDPRFYRRVDKETKFVTKSILCVPLKIKDKIVGVVQAINHKTRVTFDESDIPLLTALANQAAVAIENSRLYQQLLDENIKITNLKNYLDSILKSTPEAIIVLDEGGHITTFDPHAERVFKINAFETTNKLYDDVFDSMLSKFLDGILEEARQGLKVLDREYEFSTDEENKIPLGFSLSPLKDDNDNEIGTVVLCRDLTETKQLLNLQELSKMKSEFVSTVSHELRTPLTSIKGFIQTLQSDKEGYFQEEQKQRFYGIINREAERLLRLINDILSAARIEAGTALEMKYADVNLIELADKVVNTQKFYTKKHQFQLDAPENVPLIWGDQDKLDQVLTNIVSNAVKYSPNGGTITIKVEEKNDQISVGVTDQGIGIPKEELPKLFQRFQRVKGTEAEHIKGTGIGLHLAKSLVEMHNGSMFIDSEYGKGSTFGFILPVKSEGGNPAVEHH